MNKWKGFLGKMKVPQFLVALLLALSLLSGCAGMSSYNYTGAAMGGALGAGLGAAINHRNPWKGAAIGGLLGAAGGGVAGEVVRQTKTPPSPEQGYYNQPAPTPAPNPNYGYNAPSNPNYAYNQPQPYYNQTRRLPSTGPGRPLKLTTTTNPNIFQG